MLPLINKRSIQMHQSTALRRGTSAMALFALPLSVFAADGLTLGTGADYSSGKFGSSEKTEILYIPFTGRYDSGPWTWRLTVPYVRITGPGNVIGAGADRVVLPGTTTTARRTESGLGDIVASGFYSLLNEPSSSFGLDLGAKVKLGTADDQKGLGTGKNDYSVQADLYKAMGAMTWFGSLGYRWYGDPAGVDLRNVPYGSVGGAYKVSSATSVGLSYDYRPRIVTGGGEVSEATAFVSQRVSQNTKLQLYAVAGFGKASPDFGLGAVLNYGFQ
jgi:hypothetical protein